MVLGGVGWYVWNAKNKTDNNFKNSDSANSSTIQYVTIDSADWTPFSSSEGEYSLRHPPWWERAANLENCNPGLFMAGSEGKLAGRCGTESFGQITVSSVEGNHAGESELSTGYTDIARTTVTIGGISGTKMTGEASGQQQESEIGTTGLSDGVEVTTYIFYTNGRTYIATYRETIPPAGALRDFNTMIYKTLRFSAT